MPNDALDTIKKIVKDFTRLEVVTVVTNIDVKKNKQPDGTEKVTFVPEDQKIIDKGCYTTIDLIDGDIRNYIARGLEEGEEYDRITKFHATQVEKGQEVIKGTITALKDAAYLIKELTTSS